MHSSNFHPAFESDLAPSAHSSNCPNCRTGTVTPFYSVPSVPVHSVLRLPTRERALNIATGAIELALCDTCGFVTNRAFDETLMDYSTEYDGTQAFSPTFNTFHHKLALELIDRYDLRGKDIVEIGCGNGEFLTLLCELGSNRGTGFDPAYTGDAAPSDQLSFVSEVYSAAHAGLPVDFLCCKMTLEHIARPADFLAVIRRSLGERSEPTIFFQVPELMRILREGAFWDIYYEHCSYFNRVSLVHLFENEGFTVVRTWTAYDDQYLMIEARPSRLPSAPSTDAALHSLRRAVGNFARHVTHQQEAWQRLLRDVHAAGHRVVLWGGGSKAVSFLTTLGLRGEIASIVDVNPRKQGTFSAGTGHEIVSPESLAEAPPDVVIVMNPVYLDEIRARLDQMDLAPTLIASNQPVQPAQLFA